MDNPTVSRADDDGSADAVIVLAGRLDAFEAKDVRALLTEHVDGGRCRLVIDLSTVEFVDSAGLAALVQAMKRCREAGGDVRLVRPSDSSAHRVFELTKFDLVFTMADSVDDLVGNW